MALDPNIILAAGKAAGGIDPATLLDARNRIALGRLAAQRQQQTQDALARVQANPDDPDAVTQLSALDPAAGNAYLSAQAAKRAVATRAATAGVIRAYAPLGSVGTAPQPAATAAPSTPASPIPTGPAGVAPSGQATPPATDAQGHPLDNHFLDHRAPATQAVGAAVTAGQLSPTEAVARLAESADPAQVEQVLGNLKTMDGLRLSRLSEANNAIGSAAQTALQQFPNPADADKRRAFVMQMAPSLAQHGVTPDQIANADYSTAGLSGLVGQAIGTQGLIDQANKQREFAQKDASLAETKRHDIAGEDADKGKVVPFGSTYVGSDGKVLYDNSGNAPAAGGRTTGGWTPRISAGGDNSDAAVNSKIAGAAQFLGVKPTDDISKLSPMQIAQAMTLSEGGKGSLADRNNNPANLRNADGSYKQFPTKQAGLQAAAALVARKLANGQTSVQTMIEGLPVGGGASSVPTAQRYAGGAGGVDYAGLVLAAKEGIAHGGIVPSGYARNKPAQAAIQNIMGEMSSGRDIGDIVQQGQTTASQGSAYKTWNSGRQGTGAAQLRSIGVAVGHLDQAQQLVNALGNGDTKAVNQISNFLGAQTGRTAPTNLNAVKALVQDEVVKGVLGTAGGVHDRAQEIISNWTSPDQTAGVFTQLRHLMGVQASGLRDQYKATTGRPNFNDYLNPRLQQILGMSGQGGAGRGSVAHVTDAASYAAVPSGAQYMDPQGNLRTKR